LSDARFLGRSLEPILLPTDWKLLYLRGGIQLPRFSYLEYVLNRNWISRWFVKLEADELWAYGIWAPAAINNFDGPSRYFIRSETDLGIVGNYHRGGRRLVKKVYSLTESTATRIYRNDLRRAVQRATVVANSEYMACRAEELLGVKAQVSYPPINAELLRANLNQNRMELSWVVFVGDSVYKGVDLVQEMALRLPYLQFRIFTRLVHVERKNANILWSPWQSESWKVYQGARLVIVPSQCEEAYGRVAREAYLLGVPVLVSDIGGLPETVDRHKECLVRDFQNVGTWCNAILQKLQ